MKKPCDFAVTGFKEHGAFTLRLGISCSAQVADPNVAVVFCFECAQGIVAVFEENVRTSGKLTNVLFLDLYGGQR